MIVCFLMHDIGVATERFRAPDMLGEPFVLTAEDGLVLRVSDEAASYGIQPGHKGSAARSLCPLLRLLPYERAIYEQAASVIWDAVAIESSIVEPLSPEMCFAEIDDRHVAPRLHAFVADVSRAAKMPIMAGLGTSKLVARHAALRADPTDPLIVFPGSERRLLADVPIESLCLIDAAMLRRLTKLGLMTLGDVQAVSFRDLQRAVGSMALHLSRLAIGQDGDPVRPTWPKPSLTVEQRFDYEVTDIASVCEGLRRCAKKLAHALLERREFASLLELCLTREDTCSVHIEERLPGPTQSADDLYSAAERLLNRLGAVLNQALSAVSLHAAHLNIASASQLELIDIHGNYLPGETHTKISATVGHVRRRFGIGAIIAAETLCKARRIDSWVSPWCRKVNESVEVIVAPDNSPLQFWHRQRLFYVVAIQRAWCETSWISNGQIEERIFRVETDPPGLYELRRLDADWRVTAAQD